MEFQHIIFLIAMICGVQSTLQRKTRTISGELHVEEEEEECEKKCEECFDKPHSLERMGCYEKCLDEGVDQFTCPGSDSFLSEVAPPSQKLQAEVKEFFEKQSKLWSAKDIDGIAATFTEKNSVNIIDHQKPVIGRAGRAKQASNYFKANPEIDRIHYEAVDFGRENGITWINGFGNCYDEEDQLVSKWRIMSILRRVDGELQEFIRVLFSEEE